MQRGACDRCLHLYRRVASVALQSHISRRSASDKKTTVTVEASLEHMMYARVSIR